MHDGPRMTFDQRVFRNALGRFATGVAVVTTRDPDGAPVGVTVNSFSSVSLDPPLVLFCLDRSASGLRSFLESTRFAVNILGEDQREISRRFSGPWAERWTGVGYDSGVTGSPLLHGCLANLDCVLVATHDGGDHVILVGRVEQLSETVGRPLLYYSGGYGRLL